MSFNALGAVLAASATRDMADRERAQQLTLVGGLLGRSPLGLAVVAAVAADAARGAASGGDVGRAPAPVKVVIPDVAGLDVDAARKQVAALDLRVAVAGAVAPEEVGTVVGSEPPEATLVDIGSTVTLLVSIGVAVPDVVGTHIEKAGEVVRAAGFEPRAVEVDRPDGEDDVVLGQDPTGGAFLPQGATVVLTVRERQEAGAALEEVGAARPAQASKRGAQDEAK